jgi:hypothetical protein
MQFPKPECPILLKGVLHRQLNKIINVEPIPSFVSTFISPPCTLNPDLLLYNFISKLLSSTVRSLSPSLSVLKQHVIPGVQLYLFDQLFFQDLSFPSAGSPV